MVCVQSKPLRNPPCISRSTSSIHYEWNTRGRSISLCSENSPTRAFSRSAEWRKEARPGRGVSYKKSRALAPPSAVTPLRSPLAASPHPTHESLAGVSTRGHLYRAL